MEKQKSFLQKKSKIFMQITLLRRQTSPFLTLLLMHPNFTAPNPHSVCDGLSDLLLMTREWKQEGKVTLQWKTW